MAIQAYGEAESLFALHGVLPAELQSPSTTLPGIRSWFQELDGPLFDSKAGLEDDSDLLCDENDDDDADYQSLLDSLENTELRDLQENERLMGYRYTRVALSVDDQMEMYVPLVYLGCAILMLLIQIMIT